VFTILGISLLVGGLLVGYLYYDQYQRQQSYSYRIPDSTVSGTAAPNIVASTASSNTDSKTTWTPIASEPVEQKPTMIQPPILETPKQSEEQISESAVTKPVVETYSPISNNAQTQFGLIQNRIYHQPPVDDLPAPPIESPQTDINSEQAQIDFARSLKCTGLNSASAIRKCREDFDNN
jgi:hypothetical protein